MQAELRVSCFFGPEPARRQHTSSSFGYFFVSSTIGYSKLQKFKYAHGHDLGRSTVYDATERGKKVQLADVDSDVQLRMSTFEMNVICGD